MTRGPIASGIWRIIISVSICSRGGLVLSMSSVAPMAFVIAVVLVASVVFSAFVIPVVSVAPIASAIAVARLSCVPWV